MKPLVIEVRCIVKHKDKTQEMLVISTNGRWVECEYANSEGMRVVETYDKDYLILVSGRPPIARGGLEMAYR